MGDSRPLLAASLAGLALAVLAALGAAAPGWDGLDWGGAHSAFALYGFLLPALAALAWGIAGPLLPRALPPPRAIAILWTFGAAALATGTLLAEPGACADATWGTLGCLGSPQFMAGVLLEILAWPILLAAGVLQTVAFLKAAPKRSETIVDVARDPLTKGDDASVTHLRFAHMVFLPLALLGLLVAHWMRAPWSDDLRLASLHWLLAGHALLMTYGLSHLAIPRYSGVPAIAAGAIKGELHTSLLGLVLLAVGFAFRMTWALVAGGAFLFLGAFVFMGVLGANIMKNKSRTQRVTPEFAYIPWTFTGVFWLVAGTLLGVFVAAAGVVARGTSSAARWFAEHLGDLAFVHAHAVLAGGLAMLFLGYVLRAAAAWRGRPPVPFSRTRWAFYGLNVSLVLLFYGRLRDAPDWVLWGAALAAVSLAAWFMTLWPHWRGARDVA